MGINDQARPGAPPILEAFVVKSVRWLGFATEKLREEDSAAF
jgi:hypothetical protein